MTYPRRARLASRRIPAATMAAVLALVGLTGCGSSGSAAADPAGGEEIVIGTFSWTAAAIQTEILTQVAAENPDLGVSAVTSTNVDPAVGWTGLGRGDLDVLVEVNLPNQQKFVDENAETTALVSETYGGAAQGWFVPAYLVAPGGAAEGLTSVDQLAEQKFADAVGGTLYDADPGWVTTDQNAARIKGFGLSITHSPSSEAALLAELKRAYDREQPILVYLYRPHWVFNDYDLVQLEEPNPYEEGAFTEGGRTDVAIPTLAAHVAARTDLEGRAPGFYRLLTRFAIPLSDIETLLAVSNDDSSLTPADLAAQWIDGHPDEVESWLK
ncbi:MAG TPA: glycine betaine ABC transporter substrate-binding protein [Arachnia sp.]|nr:glycine betaine ABC transporter substrate-binding protein [Arachnia sp.]HMT86401.1 glycine betaine ABC transporter substrate-binding protein [Arachnia sp.]